MTNKQLNDLKERIHKFYIKQNLPKNWTAGIDWVQYAGPYFSSDEYIAAIDTLLDGWLVLGNKALEFEKIFPSYLGKQFGIVTNSGSSANLLMMSALASKQLYGFPRTWNLNNFKNERTKVLVPVAGFPTTINVIFQSGFIPIFVDIELDTLNIDLYEAEKLLEQHGDIKIITFAHVLGNPPNMDKVMELVKKYNLILLEDVCDGLGSTYKGKLLGSFGDFASCSFYPAHHLTGGEGGFVACNTKKQEKVICSFREWGRKCSCKTKEDNLSKTGLCGKRFNNWLLSLPNEIMDHKYVYSEIGYNLKPIEIQMAVLLEQIKKLPEITEKRKNIYKLLYKIFEPYEDYFILPKAQIDSDPNWFAFPLTLRNNCKFKRSKLTMYLEENKIQSRNYFGGNILLQPAYQDIGYDTEYALTFKNATKVTTNTFFLGTSPVISEVQINYIGEVVNKFFKKL